MNIQESFWKRVDRRGSDECWNWQGHIKSNGYGALTVVVGKNDKRNGLTRKVVTYHAHRLAWEFTNGQIPGGLLICHKCDNRACCNPQHMFLGTAKDNLQDAKRKGRLKKISDAERIEIKHRVFQLRAKGLLIDQIAHLLGRDVERTIAPIVRLTPAYCQKCHRNFKDYKGFGIHIAKMHYE